MIATVTLNTALDRILFLRGFRMGRRLVADAVVTSNGGKGTNVSLLLSRLGQTSQAWGFVGGPTGLQLRRLLDVAGIPYHLVEAEGETRVNTVIVDQEARQQATVIAETLHVPEALMDSFIKDCAEAAAEGQIWCLCGSVPPGSPPDSMARLTASLRAAGCRVLLDTSGEPLRQALRERPLLAKPNQPELEELLGRSLPSVEHVREAVEGLLEGGPEWIVASLGSQGVLAATSGRTLYFPPLPVQVVSTAGAGDALVAGIAFALESGISLEDGLRLGAACAASAVTRPGTDDCDADLAQSLFRQQPVVEMD